MNIFTDFVVKTWVKANKLIGKIFTVNGDMNGVNITGNIIQENLKCNVSIDKPIYFATGVPTAISPIYGSGVYSHNSSYNITNEAPYFIGVNNGYWTLNLGRKDTGKSTVLSAFSDPGYVMKTNWQDQFITGACGYPNYQTTTVDGRKKLRIFGTPKIEYQNCAAYAPVKNQPGGSKFKKAWAQQDQCISLLDYECEDTSDIDIIVDAGSSNIVYQTPLKTINLTQSVINSSLSNPDGGFATKYYPRINSIYDYSNVSKDSMFLNIVWSYDNGSGTLQGRRYYPAIPQLSPACAWIDTSWNVGQFSYAKIGSDPIGLVRTVDGITFEYINPTGFPNSYGYAQFFYNPYTRKFMAYDGMSTNIYELSSDLSEWVRSDMNTGKPINGFNFDRGYWTDNSGKPHVDYPNVHYIANVGTNWTTQTWTGAGANSIEGRYIFKDQNGVYHCHSDSGAWKLVGTEWQTESKSGWDSGFTYVNKPCYYDKDGAPYTIISGNHYKWNGTKWTKVFSNSLVFEPFGLRYSSKNSRWEFDSNTLHYYFDKTTNTWEIRRTRGYPTYHYINTDGTEATAELRFYTEKYSVPSYGLRENALYSFVKGSDGNFYKIIGV